MSEPNTTTILNPGVGGDTMDETAVYENDSTGVPVLVGKRPRVTIGGESDRSAIIEPNVETNGSVSLPVSDGEARNLLMKMAKDIERLADAMESFVEILGS